MREYKNLSKQALKRLPMYMSYLKTIEEVSEYISSSAVAKALDLNDVQVRKDLAAVCKTAGIPKRGFLLRDLIDGISDFLGYEERTDAILVGAGNLGMALMSYKGFERYGIKIVAAFDTRSEVIDNVKIFDISKLAEKCKKLKVKIGIITVPATEAQGVCDLLVESGIMGIWNFSPVHLKAPEDILVQNENMASSLAVLSNHVRDKIKKKK
ncbi:MAG: redox-sensing transcriptional repressor Rex [Clostridia bacterium]|nr:redox-sensing transcriptional repressor Rex [Clostridia bacterium]